MKRSGWGLLFLAFGAGADTEISGLVTDVFERSLSGVRVIIKTGGQVLQEGITDSDGGFRLPIVFGQSGTVTIFAERESYQSASALVDVASFEPTQSSYELQLMPQALANCPRDPGGIVVGKFQRAVAGPQQDLTPQVHHALKFHIDTLLQTQRLAEKLDTDHRSLKPEVLRCDDADPATASGKTIARLFGWHGFLWGSVDAATTGFDVEVRFADSGDLFDPSFTTTNESVDLGHPAQSVMSALTQSAVLVGVMDKLERAGQCAAVIYVANVIHGLIPTPIPADQDAPGWQQVERFGNEIEGRCQAALPHAGLLIGGGGP